MAPPGNQAVNGENKHQPDVSEETGLLDSNQISKKVKGVVIGQLLVSIIGVGELFELYSKYFLMEEFWSLVIVVFTFAFVLSESIAFFERRVEYYAGNR